VCTLLHHRALAAVFGGVMAFSAAYAVAASLSVTSTDLAAGNVAVAACDTDGVSTSYAVSYDAATAAYVVDTATVSGIADACFDQDFSVSLVGAAGLLATSDQADVASTSFSGTTTDDRSLAFSFTSASPRVESADVTGIHVSVSD